MSFHFMRENYKFIYLINLFYFLDISEVYASLSKKNVIDEEEKSVVVRAPNFSQLEKRVSDNFNGFENKIKDEVKQKEAFIKETEQGLEERSKRLKSLAKTINQKNNEIFNSLDKIQTHVNDRNRQNIPNEIVALLKKEITEINLPNDELGSPSDYHEYQKYQQPNPGDYSRTKGSSYLQNVCDEVEKCATEIYNLVYQNSNSIWDMARDSENLTEDATLHTHYTHVGWWSFFCGEPICRIKFKLSSIKFNVENIKSQVSSIKSQVSSLKNEIVAMRVILIQKLITINC